MSSSFQGVYNKLTADVKARAITSSFSVLSYFAFMFVGLFGYIQYCLSGQYA